jgi:hypothetical protein
MYKIDLIAASRERPERLSNVLSKWILFSKDPENIRVIVSVDCDDPTVDEYSNILTNLSFELKVEIILTVNPNKNTVQAINECKKYLKGDLIFVISDDTDCFLSWDTEVKNLIKEDDEYFIIKTSDGIGNDLITMPIFSKKYLESKDYIYFPEYEHMFCDTELTGVASIENCIINGESLVFNHLHYTRNYGQKDHIDFKNQCTFYGGMDIFKKRMNSFFGIDEINRIGKIPDQISQWMIENYNSES